MRLSEEHRGPALCLGVFLLVWAVFAINPANRELWFFENLLVFLLVLVLGATYPKFRFSTLSYALTTVFLCLHLVGAHFGYEDVPLFDRFVDWGIGSRNHYDRVVHFSFGLLMAYPFREMFVRVAHIRGNWSYYLALDVVMATSMLYELLEWAFVELFHPGWGPTFLGKQGDAWDAHRDMALASLGGLITLSSLWIYHARQRARGQRATG